jgi:hypothetical protein
MRKAKIPASVEAGIIAYATGSGYPFHSCSSAELWSASLDGLNLKAIFKNVNPIQD